MSALVKNNILILSDGIGAELLESAVRRVNRGADIVCVFTAAQLEAECRKRSRDLLLSFRTGIIVPESALVPFGRFAVNFHAAPPEFPGRDPHHFAHYHGARSYGATAHIMRGKVDAGPIVGVERCDISADARPIDYLAAANSAAERLIDRLVPRLVFGQQIPELECSWGPIKTTRKDFIDLCRVTPLMEKSEFDRRKAAVEMGDFQNLFVEIHGHRFRIDLSSEKDGSWT